MLVKMKTIAMLLILATGDAKGNPADSEEETPPQDDVICVGCDDEQETPEPPQTATVEIIIDPATGRVQYIIKGLAIELN